jgi:predicted nucleic acid-binding protein
LHGARAFCSARRRAQLEQAFELMMSEDFEGRVLSFDPDAASASAQLAGRRRESGKTIEIRDLEIAGIALARKAPVATRYVRHFEGLGVEVINPWEK